MWCPKRGVSFPCSQYDYKATQKEHLLIHKKDWLRRRKSINFSAIVNHIPCGHYDYKEARKKEQLSTQFPSLLFSLVEEWRPELGKNAVTFRHVIPHQAVINRLGFCLSRCKNFFDTCSCSQDLTWNSQFPTIHYVNVVNDVIKSKPPSEFRDSCLRGPAHWLLIYFYDLRSTFALHL